VSDTLRGILLALLVLAALLVMYIVFTDNDSTGIETNPGREGNTGLPEDDDPEPNGGEGERGPDYIHDESGEHMFYRGRLELPVAGATGWAAASLVMRNEPRTSADRVISLVPGDAFVIFEESGDWWNVILPNEVSGWVEINKCFINLPDVIPSIVYNISNAVSSEFRSSGFDLPGITHNNLYPAYSFNERLGRGEFIVPGSFALARALFAVQQIALSNGETLIVYEVFRPMETQRAVASALNRLMNRNDELYNDIVYRAISRSQFSVGNFISQGRSNHQLGAAIDVTIGIVDEREIIRSGDYSFHRVKFHSRVMEPSPMHELSPLAVLPGRDSQAAEGIYDGIWRMKSYFEQMGFTPIASEWWHFNHTASVRSGSSAGIAGNFNTPSIYSIPPFIN
jgi:D-alanyl-D-alanine dipeptidase